MLGQQTIIRTVAERLAHWKPQYLIVDPVMVAKSGDHLLEPTAIGELRDHLLPLATMVTPNLPEAGILLNSTHVDTRKKLRRTAEKLRRLPNDNGTRRIFLQGVTPTDHN